MVAGARGERPYKMPLLKRCALRREEKARGRRAPCLMSAGRRYASSAKCTPASALLRYAAASATVKWSVAAACGMLYVYK